MSYTPRSRIIKPGFFMNERLAECSLLSRLLFAGLWTLADKEGRLECRPKLIRAHIFPHENTPPDITELLAELQGGEFIQLYGPNETDYIFIIGWFENQKPHWNEARSELPEPPRLTLVGPNRGLLRPLVAPSNKEKEKKKEKIKEKEKKKVETDFQCACEYFAEKYRDKVGVDYAWHGKTIKPIAGGDQIIYAGGEDAGKIKTLLSRWSLDQVKYLIDTMFKSTDEFYRTGGGYSIGVLLACDNKLVQEAKRIHEGTNDLTKVGAKNVATMKKVLEEMECQQNPKLPLK